MPTYKIDNRPEPVDFLATGFLERTLQNAKNLLMTRMGEVPYDRLRGFNPALFELPILKMQEVLLPECDRLMLWEPDVLVADAKCFLDENGETVVEILLQIDA